jgi:hypothetical protein
VITTTGLILSVGGESPRRLDDKADYIRCFELPLSDDEALQYILKHQSRRETWNPFVRICLGLRLEPTFRQRALANLRNKSSAKLPKFEQIDVRQEIARIVGVGARNVSKVKHILAHAHPRIIEALIEARLSINKGFYFSSLPRGEQKELYEKHCLDRAVGRVISETMNKMEKSIDIDVSRVLDSLKELEARNPGAIQLRHGRSSRTTIHLGTGLKIESRPHGSR